MRDPLLQAQGLRFAYPGGAPLLDDLDLRVPQGELLHVCGRNGAGKSTLLRVLTGSLLPDAGEVRLLGERLLPSVPRVRRHLVRVPEHLAPSPWLAVDEYLDLQAELRGLPVEELPEGRERALSAWRLEPLRRRPLGSLSRGETRRAVLAGACLSRTPLLLLDEPSSGLDELGRELLEAHLQATRETGAVILTSHVDGPAYPGATRVLELVEGRLVETGAAS